MHRTPVLTQAEIDDFAEAGITERAIIGVNNFIDLRRQIESTPEAVANSMLVGDDVFRFDVVYAKRGILEDKVTQAELQASSAQHDASLESYKEHE